MGEFWQERDERIIEEKNLMKQGNEPLIQAKP